LELKIKSNNRMHSGNSNTPSHSNQNKTSEEPYPRKVAESFDILIKDPTNEVEQRVSEN